MFIQDSAWLYLDPVDDALFQQFVQNQYAGSTGRFIEAETAIALCDSVGAAVSCNAVLPSCQKETEMTALYSLLAAKYLAEHVLLHESDSTWLWDLACSDALTTGAAVYSARAVLTWPFGCGQFENQNSTIEHEWLVSTEHELSIYPNPTSGNVSVQSEKAIQQLLVNDITGKEVLKVSYQDVHFVQLNLEYLNSGVYLIELAGDGFVKQLKLIKQ